MLYQMQLNLDNSNLQRKGKFVRISISEGFGLSREISAANYVKGNEKQFDLTRDLSSSYRGLTVLKFTEDPIPLPLERNFIS